MGNENIEAQKHSNLLLIPHSQNHTAVESSMGFALTTTLLH